MSGKKESARAALARVHSLHSDFHEPILAELDREGLLDRPTKDSIVRASTADSRVAKIEAALTDPNRAPAIKYALGELRRLGVSVDSDGSLDLNALNKSMAGLNVDRRVAVKTALARAGIID